MIPPELRPCMLVNVEYTLILCGTNTDGRFARLVKLARDVNVFGKSTCFTVFPLYIVGRYFIVVPLRSRRMSGPANGK
jgi:hypothetical protein